MNHDQAKENPISLLRNKTSKACGLISLSTEDVVAKVGRIGYWIAKEYWGRGYATEAVSLILKFAKKFLNLRKIITHVYSQTLARRGY